MCTVFDYEMLVSGHGNPLCPTGFSVPQRCALSVGWLCHLQDSCWVAKWCAQPKDLGGSPGSSALKPHVLHQVCVQVADHSLSVTRRKLSDVNWLPSSPAVFQQRIQCHLQWHCCFCRKVSVQVQCRRLCTGALALCPQLMSRPLGNRTTCVQRDNFAVAAVLVPLVPHIRLRSRQLPDHRKQLFIAQLKTKMRLAHSMKSQSCVTWVPHTVVRLRCLSRDGRLCGRQRRLKDEKHDNCMFQGGTSTLGMLQGQPVMLQAHLLLISCTPSLHVANSFCNEYLTLLSVVSEWPCVAYPG